MNAPSDLRPALFGEEHGFATIPVGGAWPDRLVPLAVFAEDEGASLIATTEALKKAGLDYASGWARISLGAETDLDGIGLTATIASALADAGIAANIVAAYHHDHIFVPWARREEAVEILARLSEPKE